TPTALQGTILNDGSKVTLPSTSKWLVGDATNDSPPINVGDLVLFKNPSGQMAVQTVTAKDSTSMAFTAGDSHDWFNFTQRGTSLKGTVLCLNNTGCDTTAASDAFPAGTSMFRMLMITYYVDNTTTPGTPRLTRQINHFAAQALAGVVEDLDLTYDLVDGVNNPTEVTSLPYTDPASSVTYNSNQIRKVTIHMRVRSEVRSKPSQDYVRNHISTAVDVRSLASVDRYVSQ